MIFFVPGNDKFDSVVCCRDGGWILFGCGYFSGNRPDTVLLFQSAQRGYGHDGRVVDLAQGVPQGVRLRWKCRIGSRGGGKVSGIFIAYIYAEVGIFFGGTVSAFGRLDGQQGGSVFQLYQIRSSGIYGVRQLIWAGQSMFPLARTVPPFQLSSVRTITGLKVPAIPLSSMARAISPF